MMKLIIRSVIMGVMLLPGVLQAQNVFLDRGFWSENPSIELIKTKISEGNDPLEMNGSLFSGTTFSILTGQPLSTVKFMVSLEGNDVNTITHDGRLYLHWAAMRGDLELVKYLVEQGSDPSTADAHGFSVLNYAATTGQLDPALYDYLLANGSKLSETNHDGANALLLIISHLKDVAMIEYFTSHGLALNSKDNNGNNAFFYAARSGNIKMMDWLISQGVAYKVSNELGENAMLAASTGSRRGTNDLSVFEYLQSKGVEANVVSKEGVTPLHLVSARTKDPEVIHFFLNQGVDVNHADEQGNTALMLAAEHNDLKIVQLLVSKAKDLNRKNLAGQSALSMAAAGNSAEVVKYLLDAGADAQVQDADGNSLAFYLIESYRPAMGGRPGMGGSAPVDRDPFGSKLKVLQNAGVDLNAAQSGGNTIFILAAEKNNLELLKKVQAVGADVNQANVDGMTPLLVAASMAKNEEIMKYLISIGADKKAVTAFDESVYDLASENEVLQANHTDLSFLK